MDQSITEKLEEIMKLGCCEIRAELEYCYLRLQAKETEIREALRSSARNAHNCEMADKVRRSEELARRSAEKRLNAAIESRDKAVTERDKARNRYYHQVTENCKLQRERAAAAKSKKNNDTLVSAIRKLTRDPSTGKRLAVACHPDKVPAKLNDSASELFRFLQTIREASAEGSESVPS
jgi:predicted transcriptional regulator